MADVVGPIEVSGEEVLERIGRFRFDVWNAAGLVVPEAFPGGTWRDPLDAVARHWVVEVDGRLAGAIRYTQFDRLDDMPEAAQYRKVGLDVPGPYGLPERLIVDPAHQGLGLADLLGTTVREAAIAQGARCLVVEASPAMVPRLLRRGRRHLGPGAHDPRFPTVSFQLMLTDLTLLEPRSG